MALFIQQDDVRTELQKKIASELQDKAKKQTELNDAPDLVDDSQYMKGTKKTTSLAWVWILMVVVVVSVAIWLIATNLAR